MPITHNYSNKFHVEFSHHEYKSLGESITAVSLPSISIGTSDIETSGRPLHLPGSSLDLSDLTITFNLDKDYGNYLKLLGWLFDLRSKDESKTAPIYSTISVFLLTGKSNPLKVFDYGMAYPYSLTNIELNHQTPSMEPIFFVGIFKYNDFEANSP